MAADEQGLGPLPVKFRVRDFLTLAGIPLISVGIFNDTGLVQQSIGVTNANGEADLQAALGPLIIRVVPADNSGYGKVEVNGVCTIIFGTEESPLYRLTPSRIGLKKAVVGVLFQLRGADDAALVGANVSFQRVDGGMTYATATTDAGGNVQFDLPTENYNGEDPLLLVSEFGSIEVDPVSSDSPYVLKTFSQNGGAV